MLTGAILEEYRRVTGCAQEGNRKDTGRLPERTGGLPECTGGLPEVYRGLLEVTGGLPEHTGGLPGLIHVILSRVCAIYLN